ncbi:two-component response regulator-like APRR1 [Silene latifolia]|uniref:two-component response regulator-like APRR1 n=1 Tax=Silene latifolia TaxID=37657 RepID=UPI003D76DE74
MGDEEVGPGNGGKKKNEQFIDRSKVRILLCDNDVNGCHEVFSLLSNCFYQVTAVKSARQVINALNAEGPSIDIILCEVDLPMKKGLKLLKYIMRDLQFQRIPVIMMSKLDEVSLVVKCLRLGAADYLVKPLRSNELLNLWTHMWRRRRMLGLPEKNIVTYDFDLVASDLSDGNTNSTTLFSDDTDDKSRKSVNPEMSMAEQQEDDVSVSNKATSEPMPMDSFNCRPGVPGISDRRTGQVVSFPRKSELKIGECSAFFTYVKSNTVNNNGQSGTDVDENTTSNSNFQEVEIVHIEDNTSQPSRVEDKLQTWHDMRYEIKEPWRNSSLEDELPGSTSVLDSTSLERSCTPSVSAGFIPNSSSDEGLSHAHIQQRNGSHFDVSGFAEHYIHPFYMSGTMNHVIMPSTPMYQNDVQGHGASYMMPHYNHLPHCPPRMPGMPPFPYYPMSTCVQQGQLPANQQPPSYGNSPSSEAGLSRVDRREAALSKFRQKREKRCFDKKVRYANRKRLAERRPRIRGQFVRGVNGVDVDLNGDPSPADLDEEDDYNEDDAP